MAQAASKTCEICVSAPGTQYCLDCEQYFCNNCKSLHKRQKISTNHQFQNATDFIPEGKSRCTEHKKELTLVCNTCNVPVCTGCVTGKHNGHKFSEAVDMAAKLRKENEEKIRAKKNEVDQNLQTIELSLSYFDGKVESVINTITKEGRKIKNMVDVFVAEMIASVKERSKKERDKLMKISCENKSVLGICNDLDMRRMELDQTRQDGSLVQKLKTLTEEIDKLRIVSLFEFPNISYNPKSVAETGIKQLFGEYIIRSTVKMKVQRHGNLFRCQYCGAERTKDGSKLTPRCSCSGQPMQFIKEV